MVQSPDRNAFPALLEERLRSRGYNVVILNHGVSGHTTRDGLDRLDTDVPNSADIVLVEFGTNDYAYRRELDETERNLESIVQRVQAKGADVLLFEHKAFRQVPRFDSARYEDIYPRVAERTGAVLVPNFLAGVMGRRWFNNPDMVHPNGRGHRKIASNLERHVERAVRLRIAGRTEGSSR